MAEAYEISSLAVGIFQKSSLLNRFNRHCHGFFRHVFVHVHADVAFPTGSGPFSIFSRDSIFPVTHGVDASCGQQRSFGRKIRPPQCHLHGFVPCRHRIVSLHSWMILVKDAEAPHRIEGELHSGWDRNILSGVFSARCT